MHHDYNHLLHVAVTVNINIRTSNKAIPLNYVLWTLKFVSRCDGFFFSFFCHDQCISGSWCKLCSASLIQIYSALMTIISLVSWLQRKYGAEDEAFCTPSCRITGRNSEIKRKAPQWTQFHDWITLRLQREVEKFKCKTFVFKGILSLKGILRSYKGNQKQSRDWTKKKSLIR